MEGRIARCATDRQLTGSADNQESRCACMRMYGHCLLSAAHIDMKRQGVAPSGLKQQQEGSSPSARRRSNPLRRRGVVSTPAAPVAAHQTTGKTSGHLVSITRQQQQPCTALYAHNMPARLTGSRHHRYLYRAVAPCRQSHPNTSHRRATTQDRVPQGTRAAPPRRPPAVEQTTSIITSSQKNTKI